MISISRCRFFSSFSDRPTLGMNFNATTFQSRQSWDQIRLPLSLAEATFNPNRTQHFPAELSTVNKKSVQKIPWSWGSPRPLPINTGTHSLRSLSSKAKTFSERRQN